MKCYGFHIFGILELGQRPCEVLKMEKTTRQPNSPRSRSSLMVEIPDARSARQCCWVGVVPWTPASTDQAFCTMNKVIDVQRTSPWRLKSPDDYVISKGVIADAVQSPDMNSCPSWSTCTNRKSFPHLPRSVDGLENVGRLG